MAHVFDHFTVQAELDREDAPIVIVSCNEPACEWEDEFYAQQLSMVTAGALLHRTTAHHDGSPV